MVYDPYRGCVRNPFQDPPFKEIAEGGCDQSRREKEVKMLEGWVCPKCSRVWAPKVITCTDCNPKPLVVVPCRCKESTGGPCQQHTPKVLHD